MKTIWKFPIRHRAHSSHLCEIELPMGAQFIHAALQHGYMTLWAIVDDGLPMVTRELLVTGTGWSLPESATPETHVGTFQIDEFVWHVFLLPDRVQHLNQTKETAPS